MTNICSWWNRCEGVDCLGLTLFYQWMLKAWRIFNIQSVTTATPGMWLFEEPLFHNDLVFSNSLTSPSLRSRQREADCVKLGHLLKTPAVRLGEASGVRSSRLLHWLVEEVCASLSGPHRAFAENHSLSEQWDDECEYVLPALTVPPAVEDGQEEQEGPLSLTTPKLDEFETIRKKALCYISFKVSHLHSLTDLKASSFLVRSLP